MSRNIEGVGEVITPSTLKEKLQNFWYHYKWHSVVAIIVIFALLVCSLQFCSREEYDAYILYAGSKNIGRTASDGDVAEIATVISSLKRISGDFDENGEVSINFTNYYYLSADDMVDDDVNDALLASDEKALSSVLEHSEYYLCFVSISVYEKYCKVGDNELFIDITDYTAAHSEIQHYSDSAIYLSSTAAAKLPGLSGLPEDTLICIRRPSVLGAKSDEHLEYFENAKKMLTKIIELKIG